MKKAILLINVGSPDAPTPEKVKDYLTEFLMDEDIVEIPKFVRYILVHWLIVPKRKFASAELYRQIWTERGSPLIFHTQDLTRKMQDKLKGQCRVEFAMRCGNPSIASVIEKLENEGVTEVIAFAQFPQNSNATTGTVYKEVDRVAKLHPKMKIRKVPEFFDSEEFLTAYAEIAAPQLKANPSDFVLMSFHGLPMRATGRQKYQDQAYATAKALASRLGLSESQYQVTFQSRLGRAKWIEPYTEETIIQLAKKGVKKLAVLTPAFTADCLETIEEIAGRGKEVFHENGGETLSLISAPNSEDAWVKAAIAIANKSLS